MPIILPPAGPGYDKANEQATRGKIAQEDARNAKIGQDIVFPAGVGFVLTDSAGVRWRYTPDTTGALIGTVI